MRALPPAEAKAFEEFIASPTSGDLSTDLRSYETNVVATIEAQTSLPASSGRKLLRVIV